MTYKKYPKMKHLPWSKSVTNDDKKLDDVHHFEQMEEVVVMEKLDGECTTMYRDHIHARSIDSKHHPSRSVVKSIHADIRYKIDSNMAIVGENMYAKHSIFYDKLTADFYVFAIYHQWNNGSITLLSWEDTKDYAEYLELNICPELYRGSWNEEMIRACWNGKSFYGDTSKGYVVRNTYDFNYNSFSDNIAKYVRENHVQTDKNWFFQPMIKNELEGHTNV